MSMQNVDEVASKDFLEFKFGERGYSDQLATAVQKTGNVAGVTCDVRKLGGHYVMWIAHDFGFLGGSLGCAEGERIARGFEHATKAGIAVVVVCVTGGARMQEGVLSLMQMAKVSVCVEDHRRAGLPFISVLKDPTYGGVSASYAMQADVKIGIARARIGFAGPDVILNTMFDANQKAYDEACPDQFQSSEFVQERGGLDIVLDTLDELNSCVTQILDVLCDQKAAKETSGGDAQKAPIANVPPSADELSMAPDYTRSRAIDRPQAQDMMTSVFDGFVELKGDGKTASDPCVRGGLARLGPWRCVVLGTTKGHTPTEMQAANYGMPSPAGYRTALRLFHLAERFGLPVVTLVDTVGAWPSFAAEEAGQSEAIATNLCVMAALRTPIVTLVIGEGGSGGALGVAMGDRIAMLSNAYYGVISPEGAASILGRYDSAEDKKARFGDDCRALANAQRIYAPQLKQLHVIDEVIYERPGETYKGFPVLSERITAFVHNSLLELRGLGAELLISRRYDKFRAMGSFDTLDPDQRTQRISLMKQIGQPSVRRMGSRLPASSSECKTLLKIAQTTLFGENSAFKKKAPAGVPEHPPPPLRPTSALKSTPNAKAILDAHGPEAMATWVRQQSKTRVLITDTTMRDAHQSLLATRVRTTDLLSVASEASRVLHDAFSFECWGGATFDVAYRFLHESPWQRLRAIRAAAPNVCTQMLIRGANGVGYTSYPDNVIEDFIGLAASNGMDVFRIFDCFNDVTNMETAIRAVRKVGKVAEVAVCYTSDILTSDTYNAAYYMSVCKKAREAGAHMIGIKDMAGLLKPNGASTLMEAMRAGAGDLPIHFHTHATSSASLATAIKMVECGCDIIDVATASLADATSQPSMNAFCAALEGHARDPKIPYLSLEPLDMQWSKIRDMYAPFECGMRAGTARVFDHEIPGGQYTNLMVQCKSMGLWARWEEVLDMYRDVNALLGNVIKVTPSSKSVGDFALYLINKNLQVGDVVRESANIDFPQSVVELLEGRLGFPHLGFPKEVSDAILKGAHPLPRGVRSSAALAPADMAAAKAALQEKHGRPFSDEEVSASLLYPKVFSDFLAHEATYGAAITYLPTPAFFYGLSVGGATRFQVPARLAISEFGCEQAAAEKCAEEGSGMVDVEITLTRVGPKKHDSMRVLQFSVRAAGQMTTHAIELKDTDGVETYDGPMAKAEDPNELGSPMPGVVEKVHVSANKRVREGDILLTVSAMKMEVHVKAPFHALVSNLHVAAGDKVVEGALLARLIPDNNPSTAAGSADSTMSTFNLALDQELEQARSQKTTAGAGNTAVPPAELV